MYLCCDLQQEKDRRRNRQRAQVPGVKSRGNGAQGFKSSIPAESLRVHLVPLAMSCDSMCKMSTRDAHYKLCVHAFYWDGGGGLIKTASTWQVPKFQTPGRKAGAHHKAHCLYKELKHGGPFLSVLKMVGTLPKSKFPNASQEPTLQIGLFEDGSLRPAVLNLFCTPVHS